MEAPLVAEGIRKLGMLDYLIVNGSLTENGFLLSAAVLSHRS
jgi:hypothetical protein